MSRPPVVKVPLLTQNFYKITQSRWQQIDSTVVGHDRLAFGFHLTESNRIRRAVLTTAKLDGASMAQVQFPQTWHPVARNFVRKIYQGLWKWKIWANLVFWPPSMEQAFHETFADEEFRKVTILNWCQYLKIPEPNNEGTTSNILWFQRLIPARISLPHSWPPKDGIDIFHENPGEVVRKAVYESKPEDLQDKIAGRVHSHCRALNKLSLDLFVFNIEMNEVARRYINNAHKERDYEFEESFVQNYAHMKRGWQIITKDLVACQEWTKVLTGSYFSGLETDDDLPAVQILKLYTTYRDSLENDQQVTETEMGITDDIHDIQSQTDLTPRIAPGSSSEASEITKSSTTDSPESTASGPSDPSQITKLQKKSEPDEEKKTEEKGKDETSVEDS
jgi:hypothetical protein